MSPGGNMKAIYGTLSGFGSSPVSLNSFHNRWNISNTKPLSGVDYDLKTSSGNSTITLLDKTPGSMTCAKSGGIVNKTDGTYDPTDPPIEASIINTLNFPNTYIDDAVNGVMSLIEENENPISNMEAIGLFSEILLYENDNMNVKDKWYSGYAYIQIGKLLGHAIENGEIDSDVYNDVMVKKTLKVIAKLIKKNFENDYYNSLFTGIDLANLLHVSGKSQKAIKLLNKMLNHAEVEDLDYINYVLCTIETEVAINEGTISEDEAEEALSMCEYQDEETENKSGNIKATINTDLNSAIVSEIENEQWFDELISTRLSIYPNPLTGNSQIKVNIEEGLKSIIEIYDIQGRLVEKFNLKQGENTIDIPKSKFKAGIYNVLLNENGLNKEINKIIVN